MIDAEDKRALTTVAILAAAVISGILGLAIVAALALRLFVALSGV